MAAPFLLLAALGLQLFAVSRWDRLDEDVRRRSDLKTSIATPIQSPVDERPPVDSSRPWQQARRPSRLNVADFRSSTIGTERLVLHDGDRAHSSSLP